MHTRYNNAQMIHIVLLYDEFVVHHGDLSNVDGITPLDGEVRDKMRVSPKQGLHMVQGEELTPVVIDIRGEGEREIITNYAVGSPVYKVPRQFLLDRGDKNQIYLQGWGTIENPAEDDMNDLEVTFVSGTDLSFKPDLYTARHVDRPVEMVETSAAYASPSEETFEQNQLRSKLQASTDVPVIAQGFKEGISYPTRGHGVGNLFE